MASVDQYLVTFPVPRSDAYGLTAIPRKFIHDETLSFDARGLLAYIASFPDAVPFTQMVRDTTDGPYTTRRALNELLDRGLVVEGAA